MTVEPTDAHTHTHGHSPARAKIRDSRYSPQAAIRDSIASLSRFGHTSGCSPWRSQTLRFARKMYTNVILRNYSPRSDSDRGESSLRCFWCPYLSDVKEQCFAIPKQYFNIKILCFDAQKILFVKKEALFTSKRFFYVQNTAIQTQVRLALQKSNSRLVI